MQDITPLGEVAAQNFMFSLKTQSSRSIRIPAFGGKIIQLGSSEGKQIQSISHCTSQLMTAVEGLPGVSSVTLLHAAGWSSATMWRRVLTDVEQ